MKILIRSLFVLYLGLLLTACSIGNGRICGPQTPKVNCDKEALQKLLHPTPYLQKWKKAGISPEMRRKDSTDCGGGSSDSPGFAHRQKAERLSNEKEHETYSRLHHNWQRCMLGKDYIYTGKCYDNEIGRAAPSCEGRVLEPLLKSMELYSIDFDSPKNA